MAAPSGLVRRSLGAACATVPEPALAGQFDYDVDLQPNLCRRAVLQCIGVKTVFLVFWKGSNWSIALRISQKSFYTLKLASYIRYDNRNVFNTQEVCHATM